MRRILLLLVSAVWLLVACDDGAATTADASGGGTADSGGADGAPAPVIDAGPPDATSAQTTRLRVSSRCAQRIWISHSDNLAGDQNVALDFGDVHDYDVPANGLGSVRLWPKVGCDASGHGCDIGDTGEGGGVPCGGNGCQPPIDSKFEVTFPAENAAEVTFYNLSLVDGFTLPFKVVPKGDGVGQGGCQVSDCGGLTLASCPAGEDLSGGGQFPAYSSLDLRVVAGGGAVVGCLAPCKKWNYPAPYGLSQPEGEDPGLHMCCPTPPVSPDECRSTSNPLGVEMTDYVALIHAQCPSAYSYAYDDGVGLHTCPANTQFEVVFCP